MSKLRLIGLSLVVLSLVALGGTSAVATAEDCIDVIAYGTNPETGECYQFPNPCSVPKGWTISYQGCASES
ncbi:MAG TPA: hypothetical protein VIW92_02940 [Thermoanaerobaculia bacterium]